MHSEASALVERRRGLHLEAGSAEDGGSGGRVLLVAPNNEVAAGAG